MNEGPIVDLEADSKMLDEFEGGDAKEDIVIEIVLHKEKGAQGFT